MKTEEGSLFWMNNSILAAYFTTETKVHSRIDIFYVWSLENNELIFCEEVFDDRILYGIHGEGNLLFLTYDSHIEVFSFNNNSFRKYQELNPQLDFFTRNSCFTTPYQVTFEKNEHENLCFVVWKSNDENKQFHVQQYFEDTVNLPPWETISDAFFLSNHLVLTTV